ncbi:unnamed protein product [Lepeophtheirus salmonis]|uniref:(salmon louse) hypothetical protein n=1 Tax=Lepeophtheirus salmonis TaxID=72036 RepID=A0A7R8H793_LEPSM|nr:unnamed protein product [Lepeophtheirus salmonis]CAF2919011.1 unnamed protein product [Lepeophtheirus salmonis]
MADALSRSSIYTVTKVDLNDLPKLQEEDEELEALLTSEDSSFKFERHLCFSIYYVISWVVSTCTVQLFVSTGDLNTCIRWWIGFTRWPEALPMEDMADETVVKTFVEGCYGVPVKVMTDRRRQFESHPSKMFNTLMIYHPFEDDRLLSGSKFHVRAMSSPTEGISSYICK